MSRNYVFPEELAQRWNNAVSVKTLAVWRSRGRGPDFQRFGEAENGRVVYMHAAVTNWEARHMPGMEFSDFPTGEFVSSTNTRKTPKKRRK